MIGTITFSTVIFLSSVGLYLSARDRYSEHEIRQLISSAYTRQRPGGGRLSGASYTPAGSSPFSGGDVGKAQLLLLRMPDSHRRRSLQGLLYLAAGEWREFVELADSLPPALRSDSAMANNLGVSLLALSEDDPVLLLRALDEFERASQLDPAAPEPLFNLVVTYRRLRFPDLAAGAFKPYSSLDSASPWHTELAEPKEIDEAEILDQLQYAVETKNFGEAVQLFQNYPELCRRAVMQHALRDEAGSEELMQFIAVQMDQRYGDKTLAAMLAPLHSQQRDLIVSARRLVNQGAQLYEKGEYLESQSAYRRAAALARRGNSVFDGLFIDLNRVDTDIRLGNFSDAQNRLARISSSAGEHGLAWLKAKALAIYGSTRWLTTSYKDMLDFVSEANEEFLRLDAPSDRIRVLYYLSAFRYYGGDQDEALRLALQCLQLIGDDEATRISTLDWLIGSILYRRGMQDKSLLFTKQALEQGHKAPYATVGFVAASALAEIYNSMSQYSMAEKYLQIADAAFEEISDDGFDRLRSELMLGIAKARTKTSQQKHSEAESLLQRNLELYSYQPFYATPVLSQTLMLLARIYAETGMTKEAARKFTEAIDVVEKDDDYMKSASFRVKFDDERRELYDSAIEFEFRNGSIDAAWTYLQKYRAKLFLEFLAAFDPSIEPSQKRLDRAETQGLLTSDNQIVEYALLKDRLLIWVFSDKIFTVRSVPVTRNEIEAKTQTALRQLRIEADADVAAVLKDLGKVLIEPIRDVLDPHRTLTIIPDRALHGLPFGALKQPHNGRYLIEDFAIVISPSLTHFLSSNGAPPARDAIVGFGSQNGGASEFKELSNLSSMYPQATTFTGQQVDKNSFLTQLRTSPVFHYAGHSATDAADPLRSSILLDGNRKGPNTVTAVDISEQRLPANAVVILSSCDSSVGNSRDGIGVRGLTSAFLIGGAGSVVGSLWPVEASSTADLMIRFHQAFAKSGVPVGKALREAQLAFLKTFPQRSHPYYWSGFVVTGNFSALR
jgi:CHAT domain-containing protein